MSQNTINLVDVYNIYVEKTDSSGGIDSSTPLPLSSLIFDESNLDSNGLSAYKEAVNKIITGSRAVRNKSKPDPIAALLMNADVSSDNDPISEADYSLFEKSRLADKWRGNRVGELNELMACLLPNINLSSAGKLDLEVSGTNGQTGTIAEVKNRFNTMNAASAIKTRKTMEDIVFLNASNFNGYKAALVERIPKKDGEEVNFNPSNPDTGRKGEETDQIVRIGLQQFLTEHGGRLIYIKGIIIIAQVLSENDLLPDDYDMRFIFGLLKDSIS
jgi:hypothetical protein